MLGSCCLKVLVKITTHRSHSGKPRAETWLSKTSLVSPPPLFLLFIPPAVPWLLLVNMFLHFPSLMRVSAAPPRIPTTLHPHPPWSSHCRGQLVGIEGTSSVRVFHLGLSIQTGAGQKDSSSLHENLNCVCSQGAGRDLLPDPEGAVRVKILGECQICVDQLKIRAHPNFSA